MGNLGVATSFFNDKNKNLVRDLVEIVVETKQEMPTWLEMINNEMRTSFGPARRGGGTKRYGGGGFGARDYRQTHRGGHGGPTNGHSRGYGGGYAPRKLSYFLKGYMSYNSDHCDTDKFNASAEPAYQMYAPQAGYGGSYNSGSATDWWDK